MYLHILRSIKVGTLFYHCSQSGPWYCVCFTVKLKIVVRFCVWYCQFGLHPFFGKFSTRIGTKLLYNSGAYLQAICGIAFGFLTYIDNVNLFIGLSYLLRYIYTSYIFDSNISFSRLLYLNSEIKIQAWILMKLLWYVLPQ